MIAITRWEFRQPREALRVVSVAMQALHQMGVAESGRQLHRGFGGRTGRGRHPRGGAGQEDRFHRPKSWNRCGNIWRSQPKLALLYDPQENYGAHLAPSQDRYSASADSFYSADPVNDP